MFMFRKITWWRHEIGNIFRATGPLCWEFAGHRWIPLTKASDAIYAWTNGLVIRRDARDLGRHRAHYGVTVMDSAWQGLDEIREHAVMCFVICEKRLALVAVVVTVTILGTVVVCSDCRNFRQNKTSPSKSLQCTSYNYQQPPVKSLKPSDAYMRQ